MIMDHSVRNGAASSDSPPFNDTVVVHPIVTGNQTIHPEIQARIQKGFFQVDKNWTCYRRNYFSVYCSFSLRPFTPNATLFLQLGNSTEPIRSFAMSISAIVNGQENENRELVQHTPKRDKQSERRPGKVKLSASHPSSIFNRALTSPNHISFGIPPHTSPILDYSPAYGAPQPASQPPAAHTFERIQFQKATANNGKRRAQQQYYNLVVELYAEVSTNGVDSRWVLIAKRLSHPMVVRGRSPGHYKDGRRDSNANMGNGDSGSSGDGGVGNGLAAGMGPSSRNHVSLVTYHPSQRNDQRYGYRGPMGTDQSPLTASPLVSSSSSSPGYDYTLMNDSMNPLESMKDTQEPTFSESFDPMMSMMHNNDDGSSHYAKRNSTFLNSNNRLSPGPKLQSLYHPRSGEPVYGRYDSIHNNSGLCS
jgi:meiosis-specific transcription factor NDT80